MRIGIDARVLGTSRALDRYTRNLIVALAKIDQENEYVVFVRQSCSLGGRKISCENVFKEGVEKIDPAIFSRVVFVPLRPSLTIKDHFTFNKVVTAHKIELLFHPDNRAFLYCLVPQITTIHDVVPYKYSNIVLSQNPFVWVKQKIYLWLQKSALARCVKIITVSQNTRDDVKKFLNIAQEKIVPIYEGVEPHFKPLPYDKVRQVLKEYRIDKPYVFYLGGFGRHKNVGLLVEAFSRLDEKNLHLVLGGKSDDAASSGQNTYNELCDLVTNVGLKERAKFVGFIAEEDLPAIYSGAEFFVYPSLYEGFGFPPLEAMSCGTPVVCSQAGSLKEVGGKAVLFFDPNNGHELTEKMQRLLVENELKKDMAKMGLSRAKEFSWEKCAKETLAAMEKC